MGNAIIKLFKRFSCNCASDCHLNEEIKDLQRFAKNLCEDDLKEIREYFLVKENILNEKRRELRENMRASLSLTPLTIKTPQIRTSI